MRALPIYGLQHAQIYESKVCSTGNIATTSEVMAKGKGPDKAVELEVKSADGLE
jgi:hypothetical protein